MNRPAKTVIGKVTVRTNLLGEVGLFTWPTIKAAKDAIFYSPLSDGILMSSAVYHRAATVDDCLKLRYNQDGAEVYVGCHKKTRPKGRTR